MKPRQPQPTMKPREFRRWINRQRVLIALTMSAYDDEPWTQAGSKHLMRQAGVGLAALKHALRELEETGEIAIPPPQHQEAGMGRTVVLLDHPDARNYLDFLERRDTTPIYMWSPDWEAREAQERAWQDAWRARIKPAPKPDGD